MSSGNRSGDALFFAGVGIGVFVCLCLTTLVSVYDDYEVFKHNNIVEVGGKHYKIVEVTVNTQYEEVVK